jgi:hypothetical protein
VRAAFAYSVNAGSNPSGVHVALFYV